MTFTVATARPDNFFAALLKLMALLALIGFVLIFVAIAEKAASSISCEDHKGGFDKGFSAGSDIDRTDCRTSSIKNSPALEFWSVPPHLGVRW